MAARMTMSTSPTTEEAMSKKTIIIIAGAIALGILIAIGLIIGWKEAGAAGASVVAVAGARKQIHTSKKTQREAQKAEVKEVEEVIQPKLDEPPPDGDDRKAVLDILGRRRRR